MPYNPDITQRVRKAVLEATDQHLAIELLLRHNEEQDRETARIADVVKDLDWWHARRVTDKWVLDKIEEAFTYRDKQIASLSRLVWGLLVPVAGAAAMLILEIVRGK